MDDSDQSTIVFIEFNRWHSYLAASACDLHIPVTIHFDVTMLPLATDDVHCSRHPSLQDSSFVRELVNEWCWNQETINNFFWNSSNSINDYIISVYIYIFIFRIIKIYEYEYDIAISLAKRISNIYNSITYRSFKFKI